jgi:FdrA protein
VLISKPPDEMVEHKVLELVETIQKPVIVCFLGGKLNTASNSRIHNVDTLTDAAIEANKLTYGKIRTNEWINQVSDPTLIDKLIHQIGENRRYVVGLYTGGTLADEAAMLLSSELHPVRAISEFGSVQKLDNPTQSQGHSIIDLGDDLFTVGKPHPMIDPTPRAERLIKEIDNRNIGVFLFDVVLGWGSHQDPAGQLAEAVGMARNQIEQSNQPVFVASITGTELDPQGFSGQKKCLEDAGIVVFPSNAEAAKAVIQLLKRR